MPELPLACLQALPDSASVEIRETHISWVLLAGEFAYKVKKPVTLPFLDYGTVDKRRFYCHEELRLNRRFAPGLYLDVVELAGEPAVKMRRFDETLRLDEVCRRGGLTQDHLSRFARELADFQNGAALAAAEFGTPERIRSDALENFDELEHLLPAEEASLARLRQWTEAEWQRRHGDFTRRHASGFIREGHGDLHLGNLVLVDGRIVAFDGIEFSTSLRAIDVASEIAFTLLDLLDHEQPGLATWLLNEWLVWSGDFDALAVLRFYLVYRAMVRAKVAALRGDPAEADGYLTLALRLIAPFAPLLSITCGPSGCGKTYLTSCRLASAEFLTTVRIRSDVERKRLFGLAPDAASGGTIYTRRANARTYARLAELTESLLSAGWSVIVDAAFLRRAERDRFRSLAKRLAVPFELIAPQASPDELARRIAARRNDASEATVEVMQQQLRWFEPPGDDERL
ncbi:AAA family ATPase [Sulfuricystis multivorans]|uniref:bifunctional aminoglycoside phosphotransferase/ATP-binding protein n=1 Tax=Sulfuricystis multivorans TaxID=2211108 RepID=UPI0024DF6FDF|nr:bifunctional aminoglycoside phosphotransferase/ATP-binding protein [Sulfuricystis multivorans]